jgi:hypothetical protein
MPGKSMLVQSRFEAAPTGLRKKYIFSSSFFHLITKAESSFRNDVIL